MPDIATLPPCHQALATLTSSLKHRYDLPLQCNRKQSSPKPKAPLTLRCAMSCEVFIGRPSCAVYILYLGKGPATKSDEFLETCQRGGGSFSIQKLKARNIFYYPPHIIKYENFSLNSKWCECFLGSQYVCLVFWILPFAVVLASGGQTWLPIYLQMPKISLSQVLIVNKTKFLSLFDLEMQF